MRDSTVNSRFALSMRPDGQLDVLGAQRVLDVLDGEVEGGEPLAIDPDAHRIAALAVDRHVGDAVEVLQPVDDVAVDIVGDLERRSSARW